MAIQDYDKVWSRYADRFVSSQEKKPGTSLGDEWGTPELARRLFAKYVEPHLSADSAVAELGVGGGKYSIMAAARIKKLYGIDISTKMLDLASARLRDTSCEFVPVKTDGRTVAIPNDTIEVFYSFDSMVHIFPYDLFRYINEMQRFLKRGGRAVLEFADWDSSGMLQKFLIDYDSYSKRDALADGAFGFVSRSAIRAFAQHAGLRVAALDQVTTRTSVAVLEKADQ